MDIFPAKIPQKKENLLLTFLFGCVIIAFTKALTGRVPHFARLQRGGVW